MVEGGSESSKLFATIFTFIFIPFEYFQAVFTDVIKIYLASDINDIGNGFRPQLTGFSTDLYFLG